MNLLRSITRAGVGRLLGEDRNREEGGHLGHGQAAEASIERADDGEHLEPLLGEFKMREVFADGGGVEPAHLAEASQQFLNGLPLRLARARVFTWIHSRSVASAASYSTKKGTP